MPGRPPATSWNGKGLKDALAMIQSALPDAPSRRLLDSAGYCVGFVIVALVALLNHAPLAPELREGED